MIAAVNLGGDSDSIGAVYGQIAGAYYGFSAIPERWYTVVKMWEKVDRMIEDFLAKLRLSPETTKGAKVTKRRRHRKTSVIFVSLVVPGGKITGYVRAG